LGLSSSEELSESLLLESAFFFAKVVYFATGFLTGVFAFFLESSSELSESQLLELSAFFNVVLDFEGVAVFFFVFSSSSDELSESLLLSTFLLVFVFRPDGGGTLLYDGITFVFFVAFFFVSSSELSESASESEVPLLTFSFFVGLLTGLFPVFGEMAAFLAAGFLVDFSSSEESEELELDDCLPLFFTAVLGFCLAGSFFLSSVSLK
jgi:hypothetical protein